MINHTYLRRIDYLEEDPLSVNLSRFQFELNSFGLLEIRNVTDIRNNSLPFHRILYLTQGSVSYEIKGETYLLQKGDVLYTPANHVYSAKGLDGPSFPKYYYLFFTVMPPHLDQEFAQLIEGGNTAATFHAANSRIEHYFDRLLEEHAAKKPGYYQELYGYLLLILIEMLRTRQCEWTPAQKKAASETKAAVLNTATSYISENINRDLSVKELCRNLNVSESYLYKLFRSALNCSPQEYILHSRIERGAQLLTATDMTITQIAASLAFSSSGHFSNAFARQMGLRPGAYRKINATSSLS